jgi:hypothetical protein
MLDNDLHWTEHLRCGGCRKSSFAQISAGKDAIVFFCTDCDIPVKP